ncbi:PAS domain S-box protein [bacterium]|nr:PAS domain S-box protein [bacterium]
MSGQYNSWLKKRIDIVWIGTVLGLAYWIWQSFRDAVVLQKATFLHCLLFPDVMSLAARLLVISAFLLFCIHAKYIQEKLLEERSGMGRSAGFWSFLASAVGFIMLYWIIDSFQDIISQAKGDLLERVLSPGITVLLSRLMSVFFIIVLIFLTLYLFYIRKKADHALRSAHEDLEKSRENLYKIVSNAVDAIFVIENGKVVFVNPAAESLFRMPPGQFSGKPFNYAISTDRMQEFEIVDSAGETLTVEAYGVDITWEGRRAILASLRDVTERKQIEQQRQHFLSLISHRLKSPVVGIMEALDNMLEGLTGSLNDKQREYLLVMRESVSNKYSLINHLLTALRLETGGETVQAEPLLLPDLLEKVIARHADDIQKKGLELKRTGLKQLTRVTADRCKLETVFDQLIHNAVKFTDEGSITIEAHQDGQNINVVITDTGTGMSDADLKTLFTIRKTVHTIPDARVGLGFGLYIAKQFMLLQGGDIQATAVLNQGSRFSVTMKSVV